MYKEKRVKQSEILQLLLLDNLYSQSGSEKIIFQGGTALRWVYGGMRFSEVIDIYSRAGIYALLGYNDKALEYLRLFNQRSHFPIWLVIQLKVDPLLNNIRDEPEFQQILVDVETKYQAEHERVSQWLEENDML